MKALKNTGVAFVKGDHERNEFFESKQALIYDEQVRMNKAKY